MISIGFAGRFLLLLGLSAACPPVTAQEIELLSKADATKMSGASRSQWKENVANAVVARQAKVFGSRDTGIGMVTETTDWILLVRPLYSGNGARPDALQVSAAHRPVIAGSKMNDAVVRDMMAGAKKQMSPKYNLIVDFQRIRGGLTIDFMILESQKK